MLIGAKYAVLLGLAAAGSYGSYELINKGVRNSEQPTETEDQKSSNETTEEPSVSDQKSSEGEEGGISNPGGGGPGAV